MNSINKLNDDARPPEGLRAVWEQYKIPITVSVGAILTMVLYGKFGNSSKLSDNSDQTKLIFPVDLPLDLRPADLHYGIHYSDRSKKLYLVTIWSDTDGVEWILDSEGQVVRELNLEYMERFRFETLDEAKEYIPARSRRLVDFPDAFKFLITKFYDLQKSNK